MKRDLRSKKMPSKPMQESQADEELDLDMPMSDEEQGSKEANDEDLLPMDEEQGAEADPFEQFSDDEILEEFKKRGLKEDQEPSSEEPAADEEMPSEEPA